LQELPDFNSGDLSRHLRELSSLASFDYVPPFRGRAVHLREIGRPFDDLEIDFETLDRRKAAEYDRIENILRFARSHRCRQAEILTYFGEPQPAACGHCDNCQATVGDGPRGRQQSIAGPVLDAVRIVLSGVARVGQRRAGCGKQLLAQMLCGSTAQGVVRNRLDKLSTFGLLSHLKQPEVVLLIEALLISGLLEQNEIEPFRPVVQLTARGAEVMSGRGAASLNLPLPDDLWAKLSGSPRVARPESQSAVDDVLDGDLLARLRAWRQATCKAQNVAAYLVLSNAALEELARARPRSAEALLAIKGIGPSKVRQYGAALLAILSDTETRQPSSADKPSAGADVPRTDVPPAESQRVDEEQSVEDDQTVEDVQRVFDEQRIADAPSPSEPTGAAGAVRREGDRPSHYWTWRLLAGGFTPDECATIRGLSPDVVLDHALRAADAGWSIDAAWFLSPELIARIERVLGPVAPTRIRPLLEKLPRGTRYEEVQLVLKSRRGASST